MKKALTNKVYRFVMDEDCVGVGDAATTASITKQLTLVRVPFIVHGVTSGRTLTKCDAADLRSRLRCRKTCVATTFPLGDGITLKVGKLRTIDSRNKNAKKHDC